MSWRSNKADSLSADLPPLQIVRWVLLGSLALVGTATWIVVLIVSPTVSASVTGDAGPALSSLRVVVTVGIPVGLLIVTSHSLWRLRLEILAYKPGPILVRDFDDRSGAGSESSDRSIRSIELTALFQRCLVQSRIYGSIAIPSSGSASGFLSIVESGEPLSGGWAFAARLLRPLSQQACYEVSGYLLPPSAPARSMQCTVQVELKRLPKASLAPMTISGPTWERAIELAAHQVASAVLPRSRQCREPPWATWRGLRLPDELFDLYQRFQGQRHDRCFDQAFTTVQRAIQIDPSNWALRLELGKLQEQLGMHLEALLTYDDIVGSAARRNPHLANAWHRQHRDDNFRDPGKRIVNEAWSVVRPASGLPANHAVVYVARYRYALLLGLGDKLAGQWWPYSSGGESEGSAVKGRRDSVRRTLSDRLITRHKEVIDSYLRRDDGCKFFRTTIEEYLSAEIEGKSDVETRRLDARIFFTTVAVAQLERMLEERPRLLRQQYTPTVVTQRSLQICVPWAILRRGMALQHANSVQPERRIEVARAEKSVMRPRSKDLAFPGIEGLLRDGWPGDIRILSRVIKRILRGGALRSWHEHYNAACAFAVLLLPDSGSSGGAEIHTDGAAEGQSTGEARELIRRAALVELDKAAACSDSGFLASQRDWILTEDPDLDVLRGTREFRTFEATTFGSVLGSPQRGPRLSHWEQEAYVTDVIHAVAQQLASFWRRQSSDSAPSAGEGWLETEREAWYLIKLLTANRLDPTTRDEVVTMFEAMAHRHSFSPPPRRHRRYSDDALLRQLACMTGQIEIGNLESSNTVASKVDEANQLSMKRLASLDKLMHAPGTQDHDMVLSDNCCALNASRWDALSAWFDDSALGQDDLSTREESFRQGAV